MEMWVVILLVILPVPLLSLAYSLHKKSLHDFHAGFLAVIQGGALELFFVETFKRIAARHRPDYLARCDYLDANGMCVGNASSVKDGQMSFPSGHSAS